MRKRQLAKDPEVYRAKTRAYGLAYAHRNAERQRERSHANSLAEYGLTLADFRAMLEAQNGLCAICGNPETVVKRNGTLVKLSVDHDHMTGRVRELLCQRCNNLLGGARDSTEILEAAARYLRRHQVHLVA